jgi:dienelactone hydrolase
MRSFARIDELFAQVGMDSASGSAATTEKPRAKTTVVVTKAKPVTKPYGGGSKGGLVEKEVKYSDGRGGELVGYCIYKETTSKSKRPGLLVFPGPYGDGGGEEERDVAREYARKGMVVFLPDYYPTRNSDTNFTQTLMAIAQYDGFLKDSERAQEIAKLGYDQLAKSDMVDPNKISAIGFCFGGAMTLNLARSGAKLLAAVSLHGEYPHLDPKIGNNGAIGKYNTQHFVEMVGYADPFIPGAAREEWVNELKGYTANTDKTFDFIVYGTSVHAFSIHYSETFLNVLAFVLREYKGMKGAKVVMAVSRESSGTTRISR